MPAFVEAGVHKLQGVAIRRGCAGWVAVLILRLRQTVFPGWCSHQDNLRQFKRETFLRCCLSGSREETQLLEQL